MSEEKENLKIMPKLIIPNAYELYQPDAAALSLEEIQARYFYNLRFLWLLEPGDAILLPKLPAKGFLSYLAKIKKIDPDALHLIVLDKKHQSLSSEALSDCNLIGQLQKIIHTPEDWRIQACFFTPEMLVLCEKLHIKVTPHWKRLISADFIYHANSKAEFRRVSSNHHIPVAEGVICLNVAALHESFQLLLKITGQIIIKQDYNASGKGNIGVGMSEHQDFVGVIQKILISKDDDMEETAKQVWSLLINSCNKQLIVEVYYPNKGTFTAQFWVPPKGQATTLLNYSEIRMDSRWVGVQIPPQILACDEVDSLVAYSKQFANILQARGYEGYLCCDAILTVEKGILFTEINVRPGAETHAYILARHLFGVGFEKKMVVSTRSGGKADSFANIYSRLKKENLLFTPEKNSGVILLTVDELGSHSVEYFFASHDLAGVTALEMQMKRIECQASKIEL
jgi:hypothetical protein